ncbi:uncharacterized protein LOC143635161 [Bidens hawaiensis]|uniref:uncharacterized protein LOC143635161 n=1 Tax=Bidens hawaiensis TaxID=980011 RepID=UPI00404B49F4
MVPHFHANLKDAIEEYVENRKLDHLVRSIKGKYRRSPPRDAGRLEKKIKDLNANMISGSVQSKNRRQTENAAWKEEQVIFPKVKGGANKKAPLVITTVFRHYRTPRFFIEAGATSDIMYLQCLDLLEEKDRPAIKGQVLADFIAEVPHEKDEEFRKEIEPPIDQQKEQFWKLFTDEASNDEGAGAGLRITNPEGQHFTYAIRLEFKSTNNEAEYEALLAGLRIAKKLGARHLEVHVDSMLVANQIEGSYDAKDDKMASYLAQAKVLMATFITCKVKHFKRSENKQADTLSKLASVGFEHLAKDVRIEVLATPSTMNREVCVCSTVESNWMTPIVTYLSTGILPDNKAESRKIRHKALNYTIQDGILYRRSYLGPLLRCVDPQDANYLLREIHEGICGVHAGPRMVVAKITNTGYYWLGMHVDAERELRRCSACQCHAPNTLRPKNTMILVTASWSFQKWVIDITGPFPEAPGRVKFLIVAIDYFTKWIEAKPVETINAASIKKFIWEFIICHFELPMNLVSNNGTQFADQHIQRWLKELNITQTFNSVAHPQGNGEVECANRTIFGYIKKRLANYKSDGLNNCLMSFGLYEPKEVRVMQKHHSA